SEGMPILRRRLQAAHLHEERNRRRYRRQSGESHQINEGTLCPKGANTYQLSTNPHRITTALYRAPFSDRWEARPLEWMMDRIAQLVKKTRDSDVVEQRDGVTMNHLTTIASLGGATMDIEENYLIKKLFNAG